MAALAGYLVPLGNVIAPLVIWLVKRFDHPFIDDQGKEAVNFQISITIYALISAVLIVVLIGFALLIAVGVLDIVLIIVAAVNAGNGVRYRYPLAIRFVS